MRHPSNTKEKHITSLFYIHLVVCVFISLTHMQHIKDLWIPWRLRSRFQLSTINIAACFNLIVIILTVWKKKYRRWTSSHMLCLDSSVCHYWTSQTRPSQWGWIEEKPRHLSWWGTQPSCERSRANTPPCRRRVPAGGSDPFCSSEPAEPLALSRWSWCSELVPPAGKSTRLRQCCCTRHRWSKVQCCKQKEPINTEEGFFSKTL